MESFTYEALIGTIKVVPWQPLITWRVFKIYLDDVFLVDLIRDGDIWIVPHPLIKEIYTSDIQAIGEEIDKQMGSSNY